MKPRAWTAMVLLLSALPAGGDGDPDAGHRKAKTCAVCHGIDGLSKRPDAPNIAGQTEYYLRTQLTDFRSGKRFHQEMSIVAQALSDEDIDDLAAWYSSIKLIIELPD